MGGFNLVGGIDFGMLELGFSGWLVLDLRG